MAKQIRIQLRKELTLDELRRRLNQLKKEDSKLAKKAKTPAEKDQRQYRITMINKYHSVIKDFFESG